MAQYVDTAAFFPQEITSTKILLTHQWKSHKLPCKVSPVRLIFSDPGSQLSVQQSTPIQQSMCLNLSMCLGPSFSKVLQCLILLEINGSQVPKCLATLGLLRLIQNLLKSMERCLLTLHLTNRASREGKRTGWFCTITPKAMA